MGTLKFVASIIGFSLLTAACIGSLSMVSLVVNHYRVPWEILVALAPAATLLGLIITVAIDKPLERP